MAGTRAATLGMPPRQAPLARASTPGMHLRLERRSRPRVSDMERARASAHTAKRHKRALCPRNQRRNENWAPRRPLGHICSSSHMVIPHRTHGAGIGEPEPATHTISHNTHALQLAHTTTPIYTCTIILADTSVYQYVPLSIRHGGPPRYFNASCQPKRGGCHRACHAAVWAGGVRHRRRPAQPPSIATLPPADSESGMNEPVLATG